MISWLYDFWISFIGVIFGLFITITNFMNTIFLEGFRDVLIASGPTVLAILTFWTDLELFPSIFQGAVLFYVVCYFVNLAGLLYQRIKDMIPFV